MGARLTGGNAPSSMQHIFEADVVVIKKNKRLGGEKKLFIAKNRYSGVTGNFAYPDAIETTLYSKTLKEAIDIVSEVLAKKKFGGITKIFEEGMKLELIEAITNIVMEK